MAASCVRVDPPFVEFNDVKVGKVYKTKVTAANVGKTSKKITFVKPALKVRYTLRCLFNKISIQNSRIKQ